MKAFFQENKKTLALALPMIAGQLSQMLLGLADTVMIGHVGTVELATAAFVNTLFNFGFALSIGLFAAVSVQVSHAFGAKRPDEAGNALRHALIVAGAFGLLLAATLFGLLPALHLFRQPEAVTAASGPYLSWLALSFLPLVPMLTLKSYSESLNRPWPVLWLMLGTVLVNIGLNYLLIFGNLGFPEMGLNGAGCATLLARLIGLIAVATYVLKSPRLATCLPTHWRAPIQWKTIWQLIVLGLPISMQIAFEFGVFTVCALLMGQFGSAALAAHQIAFVSASTTFMLPLGLSMALTIRVGQTIGADEWPRCRSIIGGAMLISVTLMGLSASTFILKGSTIAGWFSGDPLVIEIAASFLIVTGIFQVFDGIQVVSMSSLRGMHDVKVPTWICFATFFLMAIPLGAYLAFCTQLGAIGLWYGLAAGLCVSALTQTTRLAWKLRQQSP